MRRITISCLALALVLLGLTHLGSAQNVTIDLTPITYPIVLPDSGGSFDYLLTVTNQGSAITATIWCMVTLPNGSFWGPVVGPATQTLAAGQTQGYYRAQVVPPRAPYGYYTLRAYIGIYPDTVWADDQFDFQHQAVIGTEQLWVARHNAPGNYYDRANCLAIDDAGNVYVTGYSSLIGTYADPAIIKYDADGNQIWTAYYTVPGNAGNAASSLALDAAGNIYVTGCSYGMATYWDYATIKHDADGNQIWATCYNGPGNGEDEANSVAVDAAGNVYATGYSLGRGTGYDFATIKFDADGNQIWAARYNGPGNSTDHAYCLALDDGANVYVTGDSYGSGTYYDYAILKYDTDGNQIWAVRYNGPGNGYDNAYSLALDVVGNIYVTGASDGSGSSSDYATIKYDADGNQIWIARYNGPGNATEHAYCLALDDGGNIYVTGDSYGSGTYDDYATIKYDANGNQIWAARYNGPWNNDEAYSIALDAIGNVYVTGRSIGVGTSKDYATIKYDTDGNQIWAARYNGPGNGIDQANCVAVDAVGNVYATGFSYGSGTAEDYATIKYSGGNLANWMPVEATVLGQPLPQECRLEGNYPNPFNAKTVARFELRVPSVVSLRVYDTAGRLVETLVDGWRSAGEHELTWEAGDLPSGMYFARLEAGEFSQVQKLILLK